MCLNNRAREGEEEKTYVNVYDEVVQYLKGTVNRWVV